MHLDVIKFGIKTKYKITDAIIQQMYNIQKLNYKLEHPKIQFKDLDAYKVDLKKNLKRDEFKLYVVSGNNVIYGFLDGVIVSATKANNFFVSSVHIKERDHFVVDDFAKAVLLDLAKNEFVGKIKFNHTPHEHPIFNGIIRRVTSLDHENSMFKFTHEIFSKDRDIPDRSLVHINRIKKEIPHKPR
ncbi:MAG: hypothetical protein WCF78_02485 [archaeon]